METRLTEVFRFESGRDIITITDPISGRVTYSTVGEGTLGRVEMEASGFGPDVVVLNALAKVAKLGAPVEPANYSLPN